MADGSKNKRKPATILNFFGPTFSKKQKSNDNPDSFEPQTCTSVPDDGKSAVKTTEKRTRLFQKSWLREYVWLQFDDEKNEMSWRLCIKHKQSNIFTSGNSNFHISMLTRHADSSDHKASVQAKCMKSDFSQAVKNVSQSKENSVKSAMKTVFLMAKENIAISKYESMLNGEMLSKERSLIQRHNLINDQTNCLHRTLHIDRT